MKRDLKLNMSHLDTISRKVQSYIDAMEAVGLAARKFEQTIKDQDSDAYNKLSEQWETNVWENEKILKYRLFIPNPFSSDEENEAKKSAQQQEEDAESARRQRNYEKLQGFRDQLDTSIRKKYRIVWMKSKKF